MLKNRVRELRETIGWSRDELARAASISPRWLQRVENTPGVRPGGDIMFRLADALQVSLTDLFWEEPTREPEPVA